MRRTTVALLLCLVGGCVSTPSATPAPVPHGEPGMQLGNFSVSLLVKDLPTSRAFYEKLGFRARGGEPTKGWIVLQNGGCTIGLFQGFIEKNTLTFNPGWNNAAEPLEDFKDVRDLQRILKERGLTLTMAADESSTGTAFLMLVDPDGNPILIDQHVPRPAK